MGQYRNTHEQIRQLVQKIDGLVRKLSNEATDLGGVSKDPVHEGDVRDPAVKGKSLGGSGRSDRSKKSR